MTRRQRLRYAALEAGVPAALIAVAWVYLDHTSNYAWTSIPNMLRAFRDAWLFDRFGSDVLPSLERLTLGFAAASVAGVAIGALIGSSRVARLVTQPIISFLRSLPAVALLPCSMVLFGIGTAQKIFIIAFVCCWPVVLNVADGVGEIDPTAYATARAYRIPAVDRFRFVTLPAITPRIFAGMRISLSLAILILVTSEMVASSNGIGYFVWKSQLTFSVPDMWAGIILLGLLGHGLNLAFQLLENRLCGWYLHLTGRNT